MLIDFWTYSCINCLRSIPFVRAWHEQYAKDGLVVIGVHAPEFAFERNPANVRKAVRDLGIRYPVALDNQYKLWSALKNNYWPAHYFIDAKGRVRFHHFGEGGYAHVGAGDPAVARRSGPRADDRGDGAGGRRATTPKRRRRSRR